MAADDVPVEKTYRYKLLVGLGRFAALFLVLAGFSGLLIVAAMVYQLVFLQKAENGGFGVDDDIDLAAEFNDQLVLVASVIYLIFLFISSVLFLVWVYRAAANIHSCRSAAMSITPGWAVGWNFIPIASLWKPYQAIKQIWQASQDLGHPDNVRVPGYFGWWWGCWIASNIVGGFSRQISEKGIEDGDIGMMKLGSALTMFDSVLFAVACFLLYRIVRDVTRFQRMLGSGTAAVFE
jgi:heme/copper-type cytochrome/quinol oxidase subunit 2